MLVTRFAVKDATSKIPLSPYDDLTFSFETLDLEPSQIIRIMTTDFILTLPLKESKRCKRRKNEVQNDVVQHLDYLVIDLDHVKSQASLNECLHYFSQYKCILVQSRSYNGVDNFNVKGILACDLDTKYAKFALSKMHRDLEEFCDLDESMARYVAVTAPIMKYKVLLDNLALDTVFKYENIDVGYNPRGSRVQICIPESLNAAKTIPELCMKVFQSMGFKPYSKDGENDVLRFSHTSESKTPGGFFWFPQSPYRMNHFNPSRTVDIFDDVKNLHAFKALYQEPIDYSTELNPPVDVSVIKVDTPCLQVTAEIETKVDDFLDSHAGTLCIKSAMGTGKSTIINHCIKQAHDRDMRVLIVTNRISVANDFAEKYNLKVYNKDKYQIGDSLICQYDSLRHYSIRYFDLVIMDEFISLLIHSRNNMSHDSANAARFYSALSRKLIIADAFINNFALRLVSSPITMIENEWRDTSQVHVYSDFNYFMQMLLRTARQEKITVSCTSLNTINAMQLLLEKHNLKVVTLTSATPVTSKELIYERFKDAEAPWDVLLFSPTLTVGVSNMNNIRHHFHYDSSMSNDVISSAQMTKRTRKAKHVHIHVKPRFQVLKTSYDDLKQFYLGHSIASEDNFMFDLNSFGELKVSRLGRKAILVDQLRNILEVNHKDALFFILKMHFKTIDTPIRNASYQNILASYVKVCKENEMLLLKSNLEQFKELNGLQCNLDDTALQRIEKIMIKVDPSCPYKNRVLELALTNRTFMDKCRYHKMFIEWCNGESGSDYYRAKMSSLILHQDDPALLRLCSKFAKLPPMQYNNTYERSKLNSTQFSILKECGYFLDDSKVGLRTVTVDNDVKEFYRWIL